MMAATPGFGPLGAVVAEWSRRLMDVILHIGVHRTATTTFQAYLRERSDMLADQGLAFWGPRRTRNGLFHGIHGQGAGWGQFAQRECEFYLESRHGCTPQMIGAGVGGLVVDRWGGTS